MVKPPQFFKEASSIAARATASSTSVFGAPPLFGPSPNISVYSEALMGSLLKSAAFGVNAKCCTRAQRLEPVDGAEEVPLSERHAAMTQDVVRRRYKEEEIR